MTLPKTLAFSVLIKLGIRVAIVITITTGIAYYHVMNLVTENAIGQLEKYVRERGERENVIFNLVADNHAALKDQIKKRLEEFGDENPMEQFDSEFAMFPDGTIRTRIEGFDGTEEAFGFIGQNVKITPDIRRRVLTFLDLSNEYGPAWHHRLENVYITTPENLLVGYWPEVPTWAHDLPADIYMPDEEYVWVADMEHNPSRETVWTGLFYDVAGKIWMVSGETPVDMGGKQIATIGHDITLNELFKRTVNKETPETFNFIVRSDGRLIIHPDWVDTIQEKQGYFDIMETGDEYLQSAFKAVISTNKETMVVDHNAYDEYLAVNYLEGPNWYYVHVYPKHLVRNVAYETAKVVLLLGLLSLVMEVVIIAWILRTHIAVPLNNLVRATRKITENDYNERVDIRRQDELGTLATSINDMAFAIAVRTRQLEESRDNLEGLVEERTREKQMILDAAGEGIFGVDLDGLCIFVNPAATTMLGYDAHELIGQNQHSLVHHTKPDGTRYPLTECPIYSAFKDGKVRTIDDEVFWRKDESSFPVEYTSTPIYKDGETAGAVVVFRNISERRVLEQKLIQSAKMATLGEMATGVAHELNQPLNVIRMAVNNIQRKFNKDKADPAYLTEKLERIENQVERASSIIDHMRIFGRKSGLEPEWLDLRDVVNSALDLIGEQLRIDGISVHVETPETCEPILGYQVQIEQVFLNLLGNARQQLLDKSENKNIYITINQDDDSIRVEIRDTGGGIPKDILPRIFEPFFTTKEIGTGTGLGLSISYGIIVEMDGNIEAGNDDQGACFIITLPVAERDSITA